MFITTVFLSSHYFLPPLCLCVLIRYECLITSFTSHPSHHLLHAMHAITGFSLSSDKKSSSSIVIIPHSWNPQSIPTPFLFFSYLFCQFFNFHIPFFFFCGHYHHRFCTSIHHLFSLELLFFFFSHFFLSLSSFVSHVQIQIPVSTKSSNQSINQSIIFKMLHSQFLLFLSYVVESSSLS